MPELVERLRKFTYRRQLLGGAAADPATALRELVGVYSSHPAAPLSPAPKLRKAIDERLDAVRALLGEPAG
jgi:hypothetical protein